MGGSERRPPGAVLRAVMGTSPQDGDGEEGAPGGGARPPVGAVMLPVVIALLTELVRRVLGL